MECPICFDFLSLARQLNCSHCFCEECLNKICVSGEFKCPICRKKHRNIIVQNLEKRWFNAKSYSKTERKLRNSDEADYAEYEVEEGKYHLNNRDNARAFGEVGNGERMVLQGDRVVNTEEKKLLFKFFFGLFWFLIIILAAFVKDI